jgi:hypothetical protein
MQTRRREYHVAVSDGLGNTYATVQVSAEGVRDALKKAYEKVSGWQRTEPEELT